MSQVEFHILRESAPAARLKLACRLVERAYAEGARVLVRLQNEEELAAFDQLLWTFADGAFVPHERVPASAAPAQAEAPVSVTCGPLPSTAAAWPLLVDLALAESPVQPLPARLIEIIDADETRRRQGRERFRTYRDAGAQPNTIHWDNENSAANG